MVLSQPNTNELDHDNRLDEAVDARAFKRVKFIHSCPSPGKEKEMNVEDSEKEDSRSPTFDNLDDGFDAHASLLAPGDEAVREYTRTGKYKRSMYVDAFNLALDTVLQDELHLFSDVEQEVFAKYRSLEYEPQFLYTTHDHFKYRANCSYPDMFAYFSEKHLPGFVKTNLAITMT